MIFAPYEGFILIKAQHAIGLGTKKYGGHEDVEFWLPRSLVKKITYKTGDSEDLFVNTPLEAVQIPEWLAIDRGLV